MDKVWEIFVSVISSVEFWKIFIPTLLALCVWVLTERSKARWEQFKLKEGNYKALMLSLKAFYDPQPKPESVNEFLRQVDLCWLYAPDFIISKAYEFIEINGASDKSEDQKTFAFSELAYELRQDMLRRKMVKHSKLTAKDFKHLKVPSTPGTKSVV